MRTKKLIASLAVFQALLGSTAGHTMLAFRNGVRVKAQAYAKPSPTRTEIDRDIFAENAKFQLKTRNHLHPLTVIEVANQAVRKNLTGVSEYIDYLAQMNAVDMELRKRSEVADGVSSYNPLETTESLAVRDSIAAISEVLNSESTLGSNWKLGLVEGLQTYMRLSSAAYDTLIGPVDRQKAQVEQYANFKNFDEQTDKTLLEMRELALRDSSYRNALKAYLAGYHISLEATSDELLDPVKNPEFAQAMGIAEIRDLLKNPCCRMDPLQAMGILL